MADEKQRLGQAAVIAAVLLPLAQVIAPVVSSSYNKYLETTTSERLESEKRKVEVTRMLMDNYFGRSVDEQKATIDFLMAVFPEMLQDAKPILAVQATTPEVRERLEQAVDAAAAVTDRPGRGSAAASEREGFVAILDGDLALASAHFQEAYRTFPTYHNVDEISNRLLNPSLLRAYETGSESERQAIRREVMQEIVQRYSWGAPPDVLNQMRAALR